jgi:FtsP/CotA-like multicopper oxidase with cupredoxin domain
MNGTLELYELYNMAHTSHLIVLHGVEMAFICIQTGRQRLET